MNSTRGTSSKQLLELYSLSASQAHTGGWPVDDLAAYYLAWTLGIFVALKGNWTKSAVWHKNIEISLMFPFACFVLFLLSTHIQKKYFFHFRFNSSGHSHVCSGFTNEETEKLMTALPTKRQKSSWQLYQWRDRKAHDSFTNEETEKLMTALPTKRQKSSWQLYQWRDRKAHDSFTNKETEKLVTVLPTKRQKSSWQLYQQRDRKARDSFDPFATYTSLVHDVTDADCWAQSASTHSCVLTCLCWLRALTVKRSYLGTSLQDDVDNEKEMLQQQRAEVAALREQLQKQVGVTVV